MDKRNLFYVKKRTLIAVAGCVWLLAGVLFWIMFILYRTEKA